MFVVLAPKFDTDLINRSVSLFTNMKIVIIHCKNIQLKVYSKVAAYLTNLECHRTHTEHETALTIKIYIFQFINYYSSIMYIAFFKGKFVGYPGEYLKIFGHRQEEVSYFSLHILIIGRYIQSLRTMNLIFYAYIYACTIFHSAVTVVAY